MNATATAAETLIDVRSLAPRDRHPRIFSCWEGLPEGGSILLVNDHDPVPLYYQFAVEWAGGFRWDYLEQGPQVWRVRICKGRHPDPGFRPVPGMRGSCRPGSGPVAVPIDFVEPLTLDVRPILADGGTPCGAIEEAVGKLIPGQSLVVRVPFEPVPLYAKLRACGFTHRAGQEVDGSWRVEFVPGPGAETSRFAVCSHEDH